MSLQSRREGEAMLDGRLLSASELQGALELDPGTHQLLWRAPHCEERHGLSLQLGEEKRLLLGATCGTPSNGPLREPAIPPSPLLPLAPKLLLGAGLAVLATGLGAGTMALLERRSACGADGLCDRDQINTGRNYAKAANWLCGGGLVLSGVGAGWWYVASTAGPNDQACVVTVGAQF